MQVKQINFTSTKLQQQQLIQSIRFDEKFKNVNEKLFLLR